MEMGSLYAHDPEHHISRRFSCSVVVVVLVVVMMVVMGDDGC